MTARYASWREVGYDKISWVNTLWVLPFLIASGIITVTIFRAALQPGVAFSALVGVMAAALLALIVGFCEETMFRGIVLRGALLRHGLFVSILISAVAFMLLHVVNVLGGNPLSDMPSHLSSQIWYGLLMAPLALKIRNLIPLILVHAMWDFSSLATNFVEINDGGLINGAFVAGPLLQYGIMIAILLVLLFERKRYAS
ncbi:MAG: CPBP family intramembrane glutamic endopeptidase [Caldilineaceae bacterium]